MALQRDQHRYRARKRQGDRRGADPARRPARPAPIPEGDHDRARQRERQDEPAERGGAHPRRVLMSSTFSERRRRNIATMSPRPTTTSHAATTITISAKT